MTTPEYTWEIAGAARRPSLADLGGDDVENQEAFPDESSDITAAKANEWPRQIEGLARIARAARVSVRFDGSGVPFVYGAVGPSGTVLPTGFFTVLDNGNGDTSVKWTVGTLPIPTTEPSVSLNGASLGMVTAEYIVTGGAVDGVRVRSVNPVNVATNLAFTVEVG